MSVEDHLSHFFKPEVRSSGAKLVAQEKISLGGGSDLAVQAFIRSTPPFKVTLTLANIGSDVIHASCSCPLGKKSQFCKHIWATLISGENQFPDFFEGKTSIEKKVNPETSEDLKASAYKEASKIRASEYRKDQYQKQKLKKKEVKVGVKISYPPDVEAARAYFELNGFPVGDDFSEEELGITKRKLSRLFHPDRGGTHAEIVELNAHCDVLLRYWKLKS